MRWQLGRRSQNVEDRRGMSPTRGFPMPRGIPMSRGVRRGGLGGIGLLLLLLLGFCYGFDPGMLMQGDSVTNVPYAPAPQAPRSGVDDEMGQVVATVLGYTEDTWDDLFASMGQQYRAPTLVLFSGAVDSACGFAQAAMGPFYCPADAGIYIDTSFYDQLERQLGAGGDFARYYVMAHEYGHHIQKLTGVADAIRSAQAQDPRRANRLQVLMELQADCYAGVWAGKNRNLIEPGDFEEGMAAASAIGDDALTQGRVGPETFTHGTSAQRTEALRLGMTTGDDTQCDRYVQAG